ncbi:MAG: RNA 2',3'-cyclic phosphodiesterase [Planctomycetes bacterium]|jgi:2'-5' RNA ligase|nr:RNA 2',3'-cyclic phosphodiesterase [Planctomycetota bacterium]MCP4838949.1 RNA 2',3'-cyclic phosphodiesterase [Planctomycetota bacterium]
MRGSLHRCFASLDLPADLQMAILAAQRTIGQRVKGLRLTKPENLHLTLKFLGEIDVNQLDAVAARLNAVDWPAATLSVGLTGAFAPSIAWVSIDGADVIQKCVDKALAGMFDPEDRFMGHVTIGRARRLTKVSIRDIEDVLPLPLSASASFISLQESTLTRAGPQYRVIKKYGIAEAC